MYSLAESHDAATVCAWGKVLNSEGERTPLFRSTQPGMRSEALPFRIVSRLDVPRSVANQSVHRMAERLDWIVLGLSLMS